jgi:hypothetical protein
VSFLVKYTIFFMTALFLSPEKYLFCTPIFVSEVHFLHIRTL